MKYLLEELPEFFRRITGFVPEEWQMQFLLSDKRFRIAVCGRKVGKTEVVSVYALWKSIAFKNQEILILAASLRQANIVRDRIDKFLKLRPTLFNLITRKTASEVCFDNGSKIIIVPTGEGDTIRGFTPNLIIVDETAFIKDRVFAAIEPSILTTKGELIYIGTPCGKAGRFWEVWASADEWGKWHVRSDQVSFVDMDYLKMQRDTKTETEFRQEYLGEFIEEIDTFFTMTLIKECIEDYPIINTPDVHCDYYLGVDIARYGTDETTFCIIEVDHPGNVKVVDIKATSKKPITDTVGRIKLLHDKWDFRSIIVDETGLGGGAIDMIREAGLPLTAFQMTLQRKNDMYDNLKILMEKKKLKYYQINRLISQMAELRYEVSSLGFKKIHHPNIPNAHDDYPDALALACWRVGKRKPIFRPFTG